jgi:hypothetical protein
LNGIDSEDNDLIACGNSSGQMKDLKTLLHFGNFAGWQVENDEYLFEICVV